MDQISGRGNPPRADSAVPTGVTDEPNRTPKPTARFVALRSAPTVLIKGRSFHSCRTSLPLSPNHPPFTSSPLSVSPRTHPIQPSLSLSLSLAMKRKEELEAAAALLLLCNRPPPNQPSSAENHLGSADPQPPAMSFKKASSFFFQPWGIRSRRSSCGCKSKRGREENELLSAATAAACNRPSPATPLDFGGASSDPSTSGSDGIHISSDIAPSKRLCAGGASALHSVVDAKVSAVELSPLVEAVVTTSKPIRRLGRKKTISELQAEERSLVEEKTMLMKLVESKRKDKETLLAENQRLKSKMASFQRARAATEAAKQAFLVPDLNEPVLTESLGA